MGKSFYVVKGLDGEMELTLHLPAFHTQVLPFFPQYNPAFPAREVVLDYGDPRNAVGHQQRAFLCYWAIRAFSEQQVIGLELGSAGVVTPMCLSLDIVGNGERPEYGGVMQGVHVKADAADLRMFQDNSFSCVVSNHMIEHAPCSGLKGGESPEEKYDIACRSVEIVDIFTNHWLRVLRPGGYFCAIFPDEDAAHRGGSGVFYQDPQHQHAWDERTFYASIIAPLVQRGSVEVERFNTLKNNFSIDVTLRKR